MKDIHEVVYGLEFMGSLFLHVPIGYRKKTNFFLERRYVFFISLSLQLTFGKNCFKGRLTVRHANSMFEIYDKNI